MAEEVYNLVSWGFLHLGFKHLWQLKKDAVPLCIANSEWRRLSPRSISRGATTRAHTLCICCNTFRRLARVQLNHRQSMVTSQQHLKLCLMYRRTFDSILPVYLQNYLPQMSMYSYHTCCIACFYFQKCRQKRGIQEHWPPSLNYRQVFEPCIFHIMCGWTIRHAVFQVVRKSSSTVAIHTYNGGMNDRSSKYMKLTIQTSNFSISNRHCNGEIKLLSKRKRKKMDLLGFM